MIVKRSELTGTGSFPTTLVVLTVYFLLFIPAASILLRPHPWLSQHASLIFMAAALLALWGLKKADPQRLGFGKEYLGNHLLIGGVLGGLVLLALPVLDGMIALSGLSDHELFQGAERAAANRDEPFPGALALLMSAVLTPLIQQAFFNGFVLQGLIQRINPVLAIYAVALLFTLAQLKLSLGLFILGGITAFLFRATGTLYAAWVFQACCALAFLGVVHLYPRLITLVGFLF